MKTKVALSKSKIAVMLTVLVASLPALPCRAFYSPQAGRWLARDPLAEVGFQLLFRLPAEPQAAAASPASGLVSHTVPGANPYAFAHANPIATVDYLGLKCCLITVRRGAYSTWSHSILSCDNGAYISHSV